MWSKVKNSIKKEFNSEPLYNEKYLKAKIKSYNGKINTNFHSNNKPKEGSQFIFLSIILIDSNFITDENYYSRVFLEECNMLLIKKMMREFITDNIEISDEENSNEEN